jgi:hypothetical protein
MVTCALFRNKNISTPTSTVIISIKILIIIA